MLICFSRIVDQNIVQKYKSKVPISGADDNYNRRIIEGLEQNGEKPLIINFMPYHSFPTGRFFKFKREESSDNGRSLVNVEYVNIPFLKQISLKNSFVREVKRVLDVNESATILLYDFYPAFLNAANELKKWNRNINNILIAPSLPSVDVPRTDFKARVSRILSKQLLEKGKKMDAFVLLTKYMKDVLNRAGKPFTVIEGIIPDIENEDIAELDPLLLNKKYVLYSGRLDKVYSIDKLVQCFVNRDDDLVLALCGIGDYTEEIQRLAANSNNVIYLGFKNRPELNAIQREATILINPRSPKGEYTKYSFPSKTMEYLITGKPLIMHKLPGIPDEYDNYIYYIENDSSQSIGDAIDKVIDELETGKAFNKAELGKQFVLREKNCRVQSKKIIDMINTL